MFRGRYRAPQGLGSAFQRGASLPLATEESRCVCTPWTWMCQGSAARTSSNAGDAAVLKSRWCQVMWCPDEYPPSESSLGTVVWLGGGGGVGVGVKFVWGAGEVCQGCWRAGP